MKNASNTGFSIGGNVLAALWTLLNLENSCCMSAEVKTSIFPKNVDALLGRRTRDPRLTYIVTQKVRHANHYTTVILTKEQWKCCQVMKIYECSQHLLLRSSWQHLLCKTWFLAQNESGQKCRDPGSNRGPLDLQSNALPTELSRQLIMDWCNSSEATIWNNYNLSPNLFLIYFKSLSYKFKNHMPW